MEELIRTLGTIAENIGGEWEQAVMIDNDTNNDLIDAYNEGVRAMASQTIYYINAIISGKLAEKVGGR